jgi:hypothetical protein
VIDTHEVEEERFEDQTDDRPVPAEESASDVERERLEWHPRRADDVEYFVRTQRHRRRHRRHGGRKGRGR